MEPLFFIVGLLIGFGLGRYSMLDRVKPED